MIRIIAHRVTVRTLDAVVDRGRKSKRAPVRTAVGVLDRARAIVGLDRVPSRSPLPEWDGAKAEQPMWESDRRRLRKFQEARGVVFDDEEGGATAATAVAPEPPIKVYFKRGCPYTRAAKGLLDERGLAYKEIDITDDEIQRSWVKLVTGRHTTPQIFVWGEPIGGFEELRELEQAGTLEQKVRAGAPADAPAGVAAGVAAAKDKRRIKLPILHPERSPFEDLADEPVDAAPPDRELEGDDLLQRVREVLDECRPMVQSDGGDIVLLDVSAHEVRIELTGNCIGCPSAQATLKQGIERRLKSRIPQIRAIASPQLR